MIIGVGTDIVDHSENEKLLAFDELGRFLARILSPSEAALYQKNQNAVFVAGRFAAKEAVLKALGTAMHDDISLAEINITTSKNGKPEVLLSGYIKDIADNLNVNRWHLSISHSKTSTIAFAIAEA